MILSRLDHTWLLARRLCNKSKIYRWGVLDSSNSTIQMMKKRLRMIWFSFRTLTISSILSRICRENIHKIRVLLHKRLNQLMKSLSLIKLNRLFLNKMIDIDHLLISKEERRVSNSNWIFFLTMIGSKTELKKVLRKDQFKVTSFTLMMMKLIAFFNQTHWIGKNNIYEH